MDENYLQDLLTTKEVAEILKVNIQTVRRYIRKGELPAIKITPRLYRVHRKDLEEFIKRRRVAEESSEELKKLDSWKEKKAV